MEEQEQKRKVGLITATSLVAGNMIGSGIFLLPSALAFYGGVSLYGWVLSGLGSIFLALVFGRLGRLVPKTGGPYVYTREGYGDFAAFLGSWGYWISIWCTNAAIAIALVSYLSLFFPVFEESRIAAASAAIGSVWLLTWVNSKGVKNGGRVQVITTAIKLLPLLALAFVGIFYLEPNHFHPFNVSDISDFKATGATAALTFFAFMGLESATIPAEDIKDPGKIIPKATVLGTSIVVFVYILSYVALLGLLSPQALQKSNFPFAEGAGIIWGGAGRYVIGIGAIISTFGALNGWILLQGQVPYAIARDNLFPKVFSKVNSKGAPVNGLIISSILITILVASNFTKSLVGMFTFMILLTAVTVVVPYLFSSMAEVLILSKDPSQRKKLPKAIFFALASFTYLMWALSGVGTQEVYYGFLLLMAGIPFYVWIRKSRS